MSFMFRIDAIVAPLFNKVGPGGDSFKIPHDPNVIKLRKTRRSGRDSLRALTGAGTQKPGMTCAFHIPVN